MAKVPPVAISGTTYDARAPLSTDAPDAAQGHGEPSAPGT